MYLYDEIRRKIHTPIPPKTDEENNQEPTATLITKVMLGVFGNTPALDRNFMKGIEQPNYASAEKIKSIWIALNNFNYNKCNIINS